MRLPDRLPTLLSTACLIGALALVAGNPVAAATAKDELGDWLIYNGTLRFSDRWSMFTEGQVRLYEVASNVNEVFVRAAGHYNVLDNAVVGLGYMHSESRPFEDTGLDEDVSEDRLYFHFAVGHPVARAGFEHRYRYELRWLDSAGVTERASRMRYRLQVTTPLNRETMEAGAYFINVYDEIFINLGGTRSFDQNRLYVAGGKQFTRHANLQIGLLWQARTSEDFLRLQIFYTHNFDLR